MIPFFRKIRQKLLTENKLSKYLLYAIGEIVLVVIGILIALSINNWNELRKETNLEQTYYCSLLKDMEQDVIQINQKTALNQSRIDSGNNLFELLMRESFTPNEVQNLVRASIEKSVSTFKPTIDTFEDLKSSGRLGLLKDQKLKKHLLYYYSLMDDYLKAINVNSENALKLFFDTEKNFLNYGWHYFPGVIKATDSTSMHFDEFVSDNYPSPILINRLRDETIFYMAANTRKSEIYSEMFVEINKMKNILSEKCNSKNR